MSVLSNLQMPSLTIVVLVAALVWALSRPVDERLTQPVQETGGVG